ncbi:MAG TPA: hypothetical protein VF761_05385 [Gemmatimonadaceae bacterium]
MHLLLEKILNQVRYIAWSNFADGRVLTLWITGLLLLALLSWSFWGLGSLAVGRRTWRSANERLFLTVATGMAVFVFLLFVAACLGGYRLPVVAVLWIGGVLAPALRSRRASDLAEGLLGLGRAIAEMPVVWGLLVIFSIAALLPPVHWDEVMYHLAYPRQWVAAGRLTVDPYAWYPFYTWNWELMQGVALMLHSETLVHLLGWYCGALATVGVRVCAERVGLRRPFPLIAAVAFAFTPTVQQYLDSGMIDIPLMLFLLAATYAFTLIPPRPAGGEVDPTSWLPAALCSGMFVGMKITGMVYVPLFVLLAAYRLRARLLPFLLVFGITGVTWYGYNLVRSGDPAPPLFSMLLHREPMYWNGEDIAWHEADHRRGRLTGARELVTLPVELVRKPPGTGTPPPPRYDGPLLGYILLFPLSIFLLRAAYRRDAPEVVVAAWYGAFVFVATSMLLVRYATFLPLAVVCGALVLEAALTWIERRRRIPARLAVVAGVLLLIGPLPYGLLATRTNLHTRIPTTAEGREDFQVGIEPALNSLRELRAVGPAPATVYLTQNGLRYDYEKSGYRVVGNITHPGRLPDFRRSLLADSGSRFLRALGVNYLVVDKKYVEFYAGVSPQQLALAASRDSGMVPLHDDSTTAIYGIRPREDGAATR